MAEFLVELCVSPTPERAAAGLDGDARAAFRADLVALAAAASRLPAGAAVAIPAMYLEAIVSRA
jgi:hypothetical protein